MIRTHSFLSTLTLLLAGVAAAQDKAPPPTASDVAAAHARAKVHNKRVLGVLCADGEDYAATLKKDRTLSRKLLYEFETVQFIGKQADAQAVLWQFPDAVASLRWSCSTATARCSRGCRRQRC
ncbi:MAG: hypothetical protein ABIP94_14440 [Planctomycetota bacterium]